MKKGTQNLAIAVVAIVAILVIVGMVGNATVSGAYGWGDDDDDWKHNVKFEKRTNINAKRVALEAYVEKLERQLQKTDPDAFIVRKLMVSQDLGKMYYGAVVVKNGQILESDTMTLLGMLNQRFGALQTQGVLMIPASFTEDKLFMLGNAPEDKSFGTDFIHDMFGADPSVIDSQLMEEIVGARHALIAQDAMHQALKEGRLAGDFGFSDSATFVVAHTIRAPQESLGNPDIAPNTILAVSIHKFDLMSGQRVLDIGKSQILEQRMNAILAARQLDSQITAFGIIDHASVIGFEALYDATRQPTGISPAGLLQILDAGTVDALTQIYGSAPPGGSPL